MQGACEVNKDGSARFLSRWSIVPFVGRAVWRCEATNGEQKMLVRGVAGGTVIGDLSDESDDNVEVDDPVSKSEHTIHASRLSRREERGWRG